MIIIAERETFFKMSVMSKHNGPKPFIMFLTFAVNGIYCESCVDNGLAGIRSTYLFGLWDYMRGQASLSCKWDN